MAEMLVAAYPRVAIKREAASRIRCRDRDPWASLRLANATTVTICSAPYRYGFCATRVTTVKPFRGAHGPRPRLVAAAYFANSGQGPAGYCSATAFGFQTSVMTPFTTLKTSMPEMVDTAPFFACMSMSQTSVTYGPSQM
jgi:hypothetical protein